MTVAAVYGFEDSIGAARQLADALALPFRKVELHRFPDGESLVRLEAAADTAVVYLSLDYPNDKLIELMLAASVLRQGGATRTILVAPYLCYMRQDTAFRSGEAVSQQVVARFLDSLFDVVVTVDPHLHRVADLAVLFPTARAIKLSATGLLTAQLRADSVPSNTILVGPDGESRQWVEAVAEPLGLDVLVGEKTRAGDEDVRIALPGAAGAKGRPVVLIDDMVSTGHTLMECARLLNAAGAIRIDALAVHMICGPEIVTAFRNAGINSLRSTDSIPHASSSVSLAPLLATALREILD